MDNNSDLKDITLDAFIFTEVLFYVRRIYKAKNRNTGHD